EDETRKLILSFANASTAEEQQAALTTSWLTPPKPITVTVKKTPEQQRDEDERASRDRERWRISMATEMISDVSQKLPQLAADKYPDLKPRLDSAINMLLASIAKYQGKNVNVVDRLKNEIDRLKEENDLLRRQNTALNKSLAVTKKVEEEELQLRENNP
ncbi:hypothetical protein HYW44_00315, partial [Candidatus Daviesbacteria bacterium]|nr:hypothetical protein [Candidatus Daviesbacteria bacterium]